MGRIVAAVTALVLALALAAPVQAVERKKVTLADDSDIYYALALPPGFDATKTYPALLAIPGGEQTIEGAMSMVERFEPEAGARGMIVIGVSTEYNGVRPMYGPYADDTLIPQFLDEMLKLYPVEGGVFYVTGHSAGGESAFRTAVRHPTMFASITTTSNHAHELDMPALGVLKDIPVNLLVGELDTPYHPGAMQTRDLLLAAGGDVTFEIRAGDQHGMNSLRSPEGLAYLFDLITRGAGK